ncbi:MAG: hypothetical protein KDK97_06605 [Verrucomicrobiales bacterium]|nr:hypothetical protein [Verrucomicrobiales bacterium]MCP5560234.1 hypothetical protein [Verrucomicrobiaceae bacterium]
MKTNPRALLGGICGLMMLGAAPIALAIPQQFGTIAAAGSPLEEYLREPKNWGSGVFIPGEDSNGGVISSNANVKVSHIERPMMVLGQMAKTLSITRSLDGALVSVEVNYDGGAAGSRLAETLRRTATAWGGKSAKVVNGEVLAYGMKVSVVQPKGSQAVIVRFVRVGS